MARQESVAAGRDDSAADVVIVGESRLPVAVMRQTQQSPWRAIDDEDDEEEYVDDDQNRSGSGGGKVASGGGSGVERRTGASRQQQQLQRQCPRRGRRGSRDESEDPATAMSVVSEQLWGLQRKLVGTYMAVARARLGRAVPGPSLVATEAPVLGEGDRSLRSGLPGAVGGRKKRGGETRGQLDGGGGGGGCDSEDDPDIETRGECVGGALDSLCAAWEHLMEAMITLDRRTAGVLACKEAAAYGGGDGTSGSTDIGSSGAEPSATSSDNGGNGVAGWPQPGDGSSDFEGRHARRGQGRDEERAEDLGPLWKGSLSEALARSGRGSDSTESAVNGGDGGAVGRTGAGVEGGVELALATRADGGALGDGSGGGLRGTARAETEDEDAMGSQAWDHAARRQLAALRGELFELCGDVAHACVLLRSVEATAGVGRGSPRRGAAFTATGGGGGTDSLIGRLPARLQELLSSARPIVVLKNLDVCHGLHGRVWEALTGGVGHGGNDPSFVGRGVNTNKDKRDRGMQSQPDAESRGRHASSGGPRVAHSSQEGAESAAETSVAEDNNAGKLSDPSPLAQTCIHALARAGNAPGDPTAWSLCLAAEACYKQALLDLDAGAPQATTGAGAGLTGPRARLTKKLGDASNELGKLMLQCAGALVQASTAMTSLPLSTPPPPAASPTHPGLGCAVCVACAELWFCRSLAGFRAVDDARNSALLLCNLASVERLKPRALARLREACPAVGPGMMAIGGPGGGEGVGNGGAGGGRGNGKKDRGSSAARTKEGRCGCWCVGKYVFVCFVDGGGVKRRYVLHALLFVCLFCVFFVFFVSVVLFGCSAAFVSGGR